MENAVLVEKVSIKQLEEIIHSIITSSIKDLLIELLKNRDLINRKQACKKLNISIPTISKMTKSGELKGYKINGEVKYNPSEIEEFIIQCKMH